MKDKTKKCRHFNGLLNEACEAGVVYENNDVAKCWGEKAGCDSYSAFTSEELEQQKAERERHRDLFRSGLTSCCEAPFDESKVIRAGRFKGHGPRYCSKCGKLAFMV